MTSVKKPRLILIGGIARSGNHLLRGLLDGVTSLAVPPDEDFFARTLARRREHLREAWFCPLRKVEAFFRRMQKDGHFERLNSGQTENFPFRSHVLDLDAYYRRVRREFRRFSLRSVCEAHFLGLRDALVGAPGLVDPHRVSLCPLVPQERDFENLCWLFTKYYDVCAVVIYRHPVATYASGKRRNYFGGIESYRKDLRIFPAQLRGSSTQYGIPLHLVAFESLLLETETSMRRLSDFLQIPFESSMLAYTQNGMAVECNSSFDIRVDLNASRANWLEAEAAAVGVTTAELSDLADDSRNFLAQMNALAKGPQTAETNS